MAREVSTQTNKHHISLTSLLICQKNIRIHEEHESGKEKSVLRITVWHHSKSASPNHNLSSLDKPPDAKGDPHYGFFYPTLTFKMGYFSCLTLNTAFNVLQRFQEGSEYAEMHCNMTEENPVS